MRLDSADSPEICSPEYEAMSPRREAYMAIVGDLLWLANMSRPQGGQTAILSSKGEN